MEKSGDHGRMLYTLQKLFLSFLAMKSEFVAKSDIFVKVLVFFSCLIGKLLESGNYKFFLG